MTTLALDLSRMETVYADASVPGHLTVTLTDRATGSGVGLIFHGTVSEFRALLEAMRKAIEDRSDLTAKVDAMVAGLNSPGNGLAGLKGGAS